MPSLSHPVRPSTVFVRITAGSTYAYVPYPPRHSAQEDAYVFRHPHHGSVHGNPDEIEESMTWSAAATCKLMLLLDRLGCPFPIAMRREVRLSFLTDHCKKLPTNELVRKFFDLRTLRCVAMPAIASPSCLRSICGDCKLRIT